MRNTIAALLFASCATSPAAPFGTARTFAEAITPAATLAGDSRFGRTGRFRIEHLSACCSAIPGQGNPTVWPDRGTPPAVGYMIHVDWLVEIVAPHGPPRPAALLISRGVASAQLDLTPFGFDSCSLLVDTDPRTLSAVWPTPDGPLRQDGNRVTLDWLIPPVLAEAELRMQLVVAAPGANAGGWLLSPALVLWVGAGDTP